MKKLLTCAMAAVFALSIVGCKKEEAPKKDNPPAGGAGEKKDDKAGHK